MVKRLPFDEPTRRRIAEAVAAAERGTSGELVVSVERRAGRYGDTLAVLSVIGACLFYVVAMGGLGLAGSGDPEWRASFEGPPSALWGLVVWIAGFVGTWFLFEGVPALLRPLVSTHRRQAEAEGAAWRAFGARGVHRTQAQTGVLLFVAEFERTAVVLGDRAIDAEVAPADWEGVRDRVLDGYREGRPAEGLLAGIEEAGRLLARHFPAAPDDQPELPDEPHLGEN